MISIVFALVSMFFTIFLAELGDKTQITTLLFAAEGGHKPIVVLGVTILALSASTVLSVLLGTYGQKYLQHIPIKLISGIAFFIIGGYTIADYIMKK